MWMYLSAVSSETSLNNNQLPYQTERFAAGLWCGCPCQSGSVHGWSPERGAARAAPCHGKGIHSGPETPPASHHDGQRRRSSWKGAQRGWRTLKCEQSLQLKVFYNITFLPILGLNAQPVAVAASAWPEADAGEGREGLQSTGDDGLLPVGCQDHSTQLLASYHPTAHSI